MHYQQLLAATKKFGDSKGILAYLQTKAQDREIMVPLTSSLYVPGVMESTNVLVEAGAGYFIEKDTAGAANYCDRKEKSLEESSKKVAELITHKKMQLTKVTTEYQNRMKQMQEMMAAQ